MSASADKPSGFQSLLSGQNIVYIGVGWAVFSLLFFLLFSINVPGEDSPFWYLMGTYILETLPFLGAALLCYRNWQSPQIASGRNVWLGIGLGMLSYFIGNLLFGWWEVYWGLDPDVSPADLFYIAFYISLGWGMTLAVLPRRLNLEKWQWVTVAGVGAIGTIFAAWLFFSTPAISETAQVDASAPSTTQVSPSASPIVKASPTQAAPAPISTGETTTAADLDGERQPPGFILNLENILSPLARPINFLYILGDIFLLIIASTLLLAFWGGRFAQSWRMIAAAAFSLYIADMWFKYIEARAVEYESGGLLEVFFVFSGVLFAIGAALEYDVSSRSRRGVRKRA